MVEQREFVVHESPAWRERSDFIISAVLPEEDLPRRFEQLFARQLSENRFELCCIPFFLYDIALGDVVQTSARDGRRYVVDRVIEPSGHYVFRVWFGDSFQPRGEIAAEVQKICPTIEWLSSNLLAIDAQNLDQAQRVADLLAERENAGQLIYETGRT
jgi:hypothetical protein